MRPCYEFIQAFFLFQPINNGFGYLNPYPSTVPIAAQTKGLKVWLFH